MGWNQNSSNPNYKHGLRKTRLYRIWANMKTRCYNPNFIHYGCYGGRGITICNEWKSDFQCFYDWAMSHGYSAELSIDRIDNDKGYSPGNCRWANKKEQSNNVRSNVNFAIEGETKSLSEWCEHFNINYKTVRDRLRRNWDLKKALISPVEQKFKGGDYHSVL